MAEGKKRPKLKDTFFRFAISSAMLQDAHDLAKSKDVSLAELICRLLAADIANNPDAIEAQRKARQLAK